MPEPSQLDLEIAREALRTLGCTCIAPEIRLSELGEILAGAPPVQVTHDEGCPFVRYVERLCAAPFN